MSYAKYTNKTPKFNTATPQTRPIPGREADMTPNNAGGYVFTVPDEMQVRNFAVLGSLGGTYYVDEQELTNRNMDVIDRLIKADGVRVVQIATDVSVGGLAAKNDHAVFLLARAEAFGDESTRKAVEYAVPQVCRTATDLFAWVEYSTSLKSGGWGRRFKRIIQNWYKNHSSPAYQTVKYLNRNGWSHLDVMRQAHLGMLRKDVTAGEPVKAAIEYVMDGPDKYFEAHGDQPVKGAEIITGKILANKVEDESRMIALIHQYKLTHEMVPNVFKSSTAVWNAMVAYMPVGAILRNLNNMHKHNLLNNGSETLLRVIRVITDDEQLAKARVHPFNVLKAMYMYTRNAGRGGELTAALQSAFYKSFKNVEKIVKPDGTPAKVVWVIDVSGSMSNRVDPTTGINSRTMAAATALAGFHACEIGYAQAICVDTSVRGEISVNRTDSLENIISRFGREGGGTHLDVVFEYMLTKKIHADVVVFLTDNETYGVTSNVDGQWNRYRAAMNKIGIKPVVINTMSTPDRGAMIDHTDKDALLIAGWDASILNAIALKAARKI